MSIPLDSLDAMQRCSDKQSIYKHKKSCEKGGVSMVQGYYKYTLLGL